MRWWLLIVILFHQGIDINLHIFFKDLEYTREYTLRLLDGNCRNPSIYSSWQDKMDHWNASGFHYCVVWRYRLCWYNFEGTLIGSYTIKHCTVEIHILAIYFKGRVDRIGTIERRR